MKDWKSRMFLSLIVLGCAKSGSESAASNSNPSTTSNPVYTITYNGNGSTGGTVPTDAATYQQGFATTVANNTGGLVKAGNTFLGWNTMANGSGTDYLIGATLTFPAANVTLYAKWTTQPTYAITYDGNTHTYGAPPTDPNNYLQAANVSVRGNTAAMGKTSYTFGGWNTLANGTGTNYAPDATIVIGSANVTLYAKWLTSRSWRSIASSSDGTKLAAVVAAGQIYTSTDSGVNWTARDSNRDWRSIASSSDGTKLVAVVSSGQIYTSNDSGVGWTARDSIRDWVAVASSSDGTKLAAVVNNGQIYTSNDSGANWFAFDSNRSWKAIASSSDGTRLAAVVNNGQVYISANSGGTWVPQLSNASWQSIAISSDGQNLAAATYGTQIYTSLNYGFNWDVRESNRSWYSIACSSDCTKIVAVVSGGQIYTSTSSGAMWTVRADNRFWQAVTCSSDGTKLAAVVAPGQIYTSTDSGATWQIRY